MSITVQPLGPGQEQAWDAFVASVPGGQIFHTTCWRDFLERMTGGEPAYLQALDEQGVIHGVLPVFLKNGPYGPVLNSLPFWGSNGGVLARSDREDEIHRLLGKAWNELAQERGCASATLITSPYADYPQGALDVLQSDLTDQRIGQLTDLAGEGDPQGSDPEERLFALIDGVRRRNIRKARKSGIEVRERSDQEAWDFLAQTHRRNMEAIGGTFKPDSFFALARQMFEPGRESRLYVGSLDGKPVSALLVFVFQRIVEYYIPAVLPEYRNLAPQSLVIFQAMLDAARQGFASWNWGGTWTTQEGVYQFKKKWGTRDKTYTYHVSVLNQDLLRAEPRELLAQYPYFYAVPFSALERSNPDKQASVA